MKDSDFEILALSFALLFAASVVFTLSQIHYIKNNLVEEFNRGHRIKCYLDEDRRSFIYIDKSNFYYKKYKFISKDEDIHLSAFNCNKG